MDFIEDTKFMAGNLENCKKCSTFAAIIVVKLFLVSCSDAPSFIILVVQISTIHIYNFGYYKGLQGCKHPIFATYSLTTYKTLF